jgi:PadR family transcriptional regulator, regulatory protein PadR
MTRQWLHGFLDLCLLAMLDHRPDYGYGLSQRLAAGGVADVPGGTIYPALLRLEQQGLAAASWAASDAGPRRKYYALTPAGRQALAEQAAGWRRFRDGVDGLVDGSVDGGSVDGGSVDGAPTGGDAGRGRS